MTRSQTTLWRMAAVLFIAGICDALIGINMREDMFIAACVFNFVYAVFAVTASYRIGRKPMAALSAVNLVLIGAGIIFTATQGIVSVGILGIAEGMLAMREYNKTRGIRHI